MPDDRHWNARRRKKKEWAEHKKKQKQIKRFVLLKRNFLFWQWLRQQKQQHYGWLNGWMGGRTVWTAVMLIMNVMEFSMMRIHEISCETVSNPFDKYASIMVAPCKYETGRDKWNCQWRISSSSITRRSLPILSFWIGTFGSIHLECKQIDYKQAITLNTCLIL